MKKSYSGLNILQRKITGISGEYKNFIDFFLTNRKYLTLKIPYYEYIRGQIFLDDLRDNHGDEVPHSLDIATLIFILYDDFLAQVKRGHANNQDIAAYILKGMEKYFIVPKKERRVMKALTKNLFEFETVEDETDEGSQSPEDKHAILEIRVKETVVLRGEVLIHEIQPHLGGKILNVEQVMAIIYLDFIQTIKNEGNSLKVQKSILARMQN